MRFTRSYSVANRILHHLVREHGVVALSADQEEHTGIIEETSAYKFSESKRSLLSFLLFGRRDDARRSRIEIERANLGYGLEFWRTKFRRSITSFRRGACLGNGSLVTMRRMIVEMNFTRNVIKHDESLPRYPSSVQRPRRRRSLQLLLSSRSSSWVFYQSVSLIKRLEMERG